MEYSTVISSILDSKKKLASANSLVSVWESWYKGKVPSFHKYYVFNGSKKIWRERLSMHMAKKVCEDWASLLMNEKVQIGVSSQDLLDKLLLETNFYNKSNKSVEYGFALSQAGLTVEIENLLAEDGKLKVIKDTKVNVGVYSAKKIVPITYRNGECVECAFVQENTNDTKLTIHLENGKGGYKVIVVYCDNESGAIKEQYEFESKKKLFALVHPQGVNNFDVDSPNPLSIFANATDTLKGIDAMFDSYVNEFMLGRKRIFVSSKMDSVDKEDGSVNKFFDTNDTVIHQLPESVSANGESKPLIYETSGSLRSAEHSQAIQDLLNFYSSQCDLGVDYYRFEKGRVMTATQVISEKSDTFRNLKKHEGVFEKALNTIITALMYAYNEFTMETEKFADIDEVKITFDDSIIEDKNTEKANDQKEVEFGAMSLVAYRMKWYAETEEQAQEQVKRIYGDAETLKRLANFTPYLTQGAITPLQFVKFVYVDVKSEAEQQALAEELKKSMTSSESVFDTDNIYNPQPTVYFWKKKKRNQLN